MKNEGYDRIQDSLYGSTITSALRKRCQESWVEPQGDAEAKASENDAA
ncbi:MULTISPECIES: hypothetical protein [unclassified Brevundimonas]|nr:MULTISPECIES: hypothetical protein [unclassified Brevundimonas]